MRSMLALLIVALSVDLIFAQAAEDGGKARKGYLAKRAAEKASAERSVAELSVRDVGSLSADDNIRLAFAQNELGDNRAALEAVCRVDDETLAKKQQLDLKAMCFHNVSRSDDIAVRIRELAFIDRCLDRKYGNEAVWLWRKAKVVCQSAVAQATPTRGDNIGEPERIIDREQYEYSFELLQRACRLDAQALRSQGFHHEFTWPGDFPKLHTEARFAELVKGLEKSGQ
jgi:hypothetical protein